ncbi:xanthine dehydrogenase family protein molybdopterin-binding subunit [Flagellimonas hymeniacidonis]|uniref:Xanthine dehydrogenase family protein molybdopterin-binding subunit n=1 Tax=Flagellimonas hymeniacidonis TaxID=2603628 RepID=A0A5C8V9B1_9FLAO|nr:molybdopterin cofactor-binding domain-containing protein [Flagellimonas hymeniacidonis]TXN38302.1 xanthine dehydrogenase family protein molybdopterin-binding subunit [Flagellimonas hymeniacidonis]
MINRRDFMNLSFTAGSGLILGVNYSCIQGNTEKHEKIEIKNYSFNPFLELTNTNKATIYIPVPEIGQGPRTALAMIVCEELEIPFANVSVKQAIASTIYGDMSAAGSETIDKFYLPLREAGATAKDMLKLAAANIWNVTSKNLHCKNGYVLDTESERKLSYGELADEASKLPIPESVGLKKPQDFNLIGTKQKSPDLRDMVTGKAIYGFDASLEGMKYVSIVRHPVREAKVKSFKPERALAIPGVSQVIEVKHFKPIPYAEVLPGVAVIAKDSYTALKAKKLLEIEWDLSEIENEDEEAFQNQYQKLKSQPPEFVLRKPDISKIISDRVLEFDYKIPFWGHFCMEPMNFLASYHDDKCVLIGSNQRPNLIQDLISKIFKLPLENVIVETTLGGGGFGRRLAVDYALEALIISKEVGHPVKTLWTREENTLQDYFRSLSYHNFRIGIKNNQIHSWFHHIMTKPIAGGPRYEVQGAADIPFNIENIAIGYTPLKTNIRIGSWRSVSHSYNVFVVNNVITEVALGLGLDPFRYYLELLGNENSKTIKLPLRGSRGTVECNLDRLRNVLVKAAELSGWNDQNGKNSALGIACTYFKKSYAAHVAEVIMKNNKVRLTKITSVLDCGKVVNPLGVRAQMEGSISDAIAVTLKSNITIQDGQPQELNFDAHDITRIQDMPELQLHIIDSNENPSGAGEPPFPSVPPAIANAVFTLTNKKIRTLPIQI